MSTVLLVRHARSAANAGMVLAGRTPGVALDPTGEDQVVELGRRLTDLPIAAVVSSPLDRCLATAAAVVAGRPDLEVAIDEDLNECDYGDWTGQELKALAKTPLWRTVQAHPAGAQFPNGETMRAMQARAVESVRRHDARIEAAHGPDAIWLAVSHGDVIKSVIADALGAHLDEFQRIVVDPASVSVVRYTPLRPFVLHVNHTGSLAGLRPPKRRRRSGRTSGDAVVGGTTG